MMMFCYRQETLPLTARLVYRPSDMLRSSNTLITSSKKIFSMQGENNYCIFALRQ